LSLFQNPVGFEASSWKNQQKPGFSSKSKEALIYSIENKSVLL
jgi:hypothetical protein